MLNYTAIGSPLKEYGQVGPTKGNLTLNFIK